MQKITITAICAILLSILGACNTAQDGDKFIHVENGQFIRNGKPYRYIGTNFWYGPLLAIEGEQGDRERLPNIYYKFMRIKV